MGFVITSEGPHWEHIIDQWYRGRYPGSAEDKEFLLCADCAESYVADNAMFEREGEDGDFAQVSGFLDAIQADGQELCAHCGEVGDRFQPETPTTTRSVLKVLALCLALPALQACAHSTSYMVATPDSHVVRCENTDYSIGPQLWQHGPSWGATEHCAVLRIDPQTGKPTWIAIPNI